MCSDRHISDYCWQTDWNVIKKGIHPAYQWHLSQATLVCVLPCEAADASLLPSASKFTVSEDIQMWSAGCELTLRLFKKKPKNMLAVLLYYTYWLSLKAKMQADRLTQCNCTAQFSVGSCIRFETAAKPDETLCIFHMCFICAFIHILH